MPIAAPARERWSRILQPVPQPSSTRRDIQGIRALAVVAVLFNHVLGFPTGGFAGVDVFFVVSGFLITGILLREYEKTGSVSAVTFYKRRAKRILPAATLVLLFTVAVALLTMLRSRALAVWTDAWWAFLFAANWRFAFTGTDYFAQGAGTSPVQHYWSLSVEEQFYFVWPWLLLALLLLIHRGLGGRRSADTASSHTARTERVSARKIATVLIAAIAGASFVWAWYDTRVDPTVAYFSTWTRAWELGLGAALATTASWWARLPSSLRPVLSWVGLVGAVASMFVITESSPFPFPWAVLPVGFSALMIVAGIGHEPRFVPLLTNRASGFLGDISYSLYLWHFPVAIFGAALLPANTLVKIGLMGIGLILATGSYYLVEGPLHRSPWLSGKNGDARRAAWAQWRQDFRPSLRFFAAFTAVGIIASLVGGWAVLARAGGSTQVGGDLGQLPAVAVSGTSGTALQAELRAAMAAASWPSLSPSLESAGDDRGPEERDGCLEPAVLDPARCLYGSGDKRALLIGDSYAASSGTMVTAALQPLGYRVQVYGWYSCAINTAPLAWPSQPQFEAACNDSKSQLAEFVRETRPDLLIVLDSEVAYEGVAKGGGDWAAGRRAALAELKPLVPRLVVVTANPVGKGISTCATVFSTPRDCEAPISKTYVDKFLADAEAARQVGVQFVDTRALFSADGTVPAFAAGTTQRFDSGHLTASYGRLAAPALREQLGE